MAGADNREDDDSSAAGPSPSKRAKTIPALEKWESGAPYYFFLTKVRGIDGVHNAKSFHISEILSPSMGKLVASVQFNYMFDIPWLIQQYPPEFRKSPILLVHGETREGKAAIEKEASSFPNVELCQAKLEIMYGTHHTKMMILLYEDGLRVVIHTSNLVNGDWDQKTQGMWISPVFPKLQGRGTEHTEGDSDTLFKVDLLEYLESYKSPKLVKWIKHIEQHNLKSAKVHLIASSPGRHTGSRKSSFGHLKLRRILRMHGPSQKVDEKWEVVGQFSSIGTLGASPTNWLTTELLTTFSSTVGIITVAKKPPIRLIYPTVENVRKSLEGYPAGASLPYSLHVAQKQPWLQDYLYCWKSDDRGRSAASPHIKTYFRASSDYKHISWFLLTSANLSKAAWGALEKQESQLMIRSYELGVLFLPQHFNGQEHFCHEPNKSKCFQMPYDLPPVRYGPKDRPWIWNIPYTQLPDCNGNMWVPP